jgi:hypothetical protein
MRQQVRRARVPARSDRVSAAVGKDKPDSGSPTPRRGLQCGTRGVHRRRGGRVHRPVRSRGGRGATTETRRRGTARTAPRRRLGFATLWRCSRLVLLEPLADCCGTAGQFNVTFGGRACQSLARPRYRQRDRTAADASRPSIELEPAVFFDRSTGTLVRTTPFPDSPTSPPTSGCFFVVTSVGLPWVAQDTPEPICGGYPHAVMRAMAAARRVRTTSEL